MTRLLVLVVALVGGAGCAYAADSEGQAGSSASPESATAVPQAVAGAKRAAASAGLDGVLPNGFSRRGGKVLLRAGRKIDRHLTASDLVSSNAPSLRTPFLVWTQSRSGSEWFMGRLSQHFDVCSSPHVCHMCPTESLSPFKISNATCYASTYEMTDSDDPSDRFKAYLGALFEAGSAENTNTGQLTGQWGHNVGVVGHAVGYKFESGYWHGYETRTGLTEAEGMNSLRELGVRVVHLDRANKFNQFLSGASAMKTNVWHVLTSQSLKAAAAPKDERLEVDIPDMLLHIRAQLEERRVSERALTNSGINHISVSYERCSSRNATVARGCWCAVHHFLRLPCAESSSPSLFTKTGTMPQRSRVRNYDDVASALRQNGFGHFLEESSGD